MARTPDSASLSAGWRAPTTRWAHFGAVAFALAVLVVGTNIPSPLYAVYQHRFGFSALVVTTIFAVYCAALIPSLLICGPLSDAVGARRVVIPGLAVAALGSLVLALAGSTGWLYAGRALQGLATGATSGALTAALVHTEPTTNRARASLVASTVLCAGAGLGPILAGALAEYAPAPRQFSYLIEIALLILAMAATASLLPAPAARRGSWRPRRPTVPEGTRAGFFRASLVSALAWAVAAVFLALIPSYATSLLHSASLLVAGAASGLLLVGAAVAQLLLARSGYHLAQSLGLVLLVVGAAALLAAAALSSLVLLLVAVVIAGGGQGLSFMGAIRQANDVAPSAERSGFLAAFYVVTYVGEGLPVIGVGFLASRIGLLPGVEIVLVAIGAVCLAVLVGFHLLKGAR